MWSPTHVQVLVKKAKGLKIKGKDGTNDAFVTIALGKEKYQTSVKEKATDQVDWCEQCELSIPSQGNTAEIVLNVLHRNFLGVDEFLGMVSMPLRDFDVYERPKTKWYPLKCKPGQNKNDYRGDLEVRTSFTVKAMDTDGFGSTADVSSKSKRGSLVSLNKAVGNFGGSLMSLGQKEKKNIKKVVKSVSHKVEKVGQKALNHRKTLSAQHREQANPSPGALPDKFDINHSNVVTTPKSSANPFLKKSLRNSGGPNRDPGVNSDDEDDFDGDLGDDDMFRFDALSHRSSGNSLNVSENMGVVSKTSTPLSGSIENLGVGNNDLLRNFGQVRKGLASGSQSPLVTNSRTLSNTLPRKSTPSSSILEDQKPEGSSSVLDEWEQKLLGKKSAVPYISPNNQAAKSETLSIQSSTHSSRSNTLERQKVKSTLPTNVLPLPTHEETPNGHKKKIIPVGSDFEGSPSPEFPSSPSETPKMVSELEENKKNKKMNFKWKSSVSFRDKDLSSRGHHKVSTESLHQQSGNVKTHRRNSSDGSGSSQQGVPTGTRVAPLGRETTPTPNVPQRIPKEVWDRFEGKTREDLIETIVQLQGQLELQGKKQVDLEDYLDSLLMKVMARNPELLAKDMSMTPAPKLTASIKRGLFDAWVKDGKQ